MFEEQIMFLVYVIFQNMFFFLYSIEGVQVVVYYIGYINVEGGGDYICIVDEGMIVLMENWYYYCFCMFVDEVDIDIGQLFQVIFLYIDKFKDVCFFQGYKIFFQEGSFFLWIRIISLVVMYFVRLVGGIGESRYKVFICIVFYCFVYMVKVQVGQ